MGAGRKLECLIEYSPGGFQIVTSVPGVREDAPPNKLAVGEVKPVKNGQDQNGEATTTLEGDVLTVAIKMLEGQNEGKTLMMIRTLVDDETINLVTYFTHVPDAKCTRRMAKSHGAVFTPLPDSVEAM